MFSPSSGRRGHTPEPILVMPDDDDDSPLDLEGIQRKESLESGGSKNGVSGRLSALFHSRLSFSNQITQKNLHKEEEEESTDDEDLILEDPPKSPHKPPKVSRIPLGNIKEDRPASPHEKSKRTTPRSPRALLNKLIVKENKSNPSSNKGSSHRSASSTVVVTTTSPRPTSLGSTPNPIHNITSEPSPRLPPRSVHSPRGPRGIDAPNSHPMTLNLDIITPFTPNTHLDHHPSSVHPALSPRTLSRDIEEPKKERGPLGAKNMASWVELLFTLTDVMVVDFFSVFEQFGISKELLLDEIIANFHGEPAILRSKDDHRILLRVVVLWERTLGKYYRSIDPDFHRKLVKFLTTECSNLGPSGNGRILLIECGGKKEVGKAITASMFAIFRKIQPTEFHSGAWDSKDKEQKAPKLTKLSRLFNRVSYAVAESILYCCPHEREASLLYCINLAKFLWKINNFEGMAAVMSGLNSAAIRRLKPLWFSLPSKTKRLFEQMDGIVTQTRNFKQYHAVFSKITPPAIPWIAPKLREVRFFYDGNQMVEGNSVNVDFLLLLGSSISEIRQFQNVPFPTPPYPSYSLNLLLESTPFTEDEHYNRSLSIFPIPVAPKPFISSASSPALQGVAPCANAGTTSDPTSSSTSTTPPPPSGPSPPPPSPPFPPSPPSFFSSSPPSSPRSTSTRTCCSLSPSSFPLPPRASSGFPNHQPPPLPPALISSEISLSSSTLSGSSIISSLFLHSSPSSSSPSRPPPPRPRSSSPTSFPNYHPPPLPSTTRVPSDNY